MKKTKKALLAAIACSAVLAGGIGLAACTGGGGGGHTHNFDEWEVTQNPGNGRTGLATRECGNSGCNATTDDTQIVLPALDDPDAASVYTYETTTEATCSVEEVLTYTYNISDTESVSFDVTGTVNANKHAFTAVNDGADGHHEECANNSAHNTSTVAHNTENGGACSVCDNIDLNTAITVTGATANAPKRYSIALEAGDYQIVIDDEPVDEGEDVAIGTLSGNNLTELDSVGYDKVITVETDGIYTVEAYSNKTFKVREAVLHDHVYIGENEGWSNADADGVQTRTCDKCGDVEYNYNGTELTVGATVNTAGNYTATMHVEDFYGPYIESISVILTAEDTAKMYTVKSLNDDTRISCGDNSLSEKGESFTVVVEVGEELYLTLYASLATAEIGSDIDVAFRVTEEGAPPLGSDILRPVKVSAEGENIGPERSVTAGDEVYFKIDGSYSSPFNSKTVKVTGDGVQIYVIGNNINGTATPISADGIVSVGYSDYYLYAVSEGTECELNFEIYYAPGEKENPIDAEIGGAANTVNLSNAFGLWYKLDGLTSGMKYIIKTTASESSLYLYGDLDSDEPVMTAESGAALVFTPDATTVYIQASGSGTYDFTVDVFDETNDKGFAASDPLEITAAGDIDVEKVYYAITPEVSGEALLKFESTEKTVYFYRYSDEDYTEQVAFGSNQMTFFMQANQTYYVKVVNGGGATGNINFTFEEYVAHNYTITVTDGTNTYNDVEVSLYYIEYVEDGDDYKLVEHVVDKEATNNGDGTYTFETVDSSKDYYVRVTGLPATHGYYEDELYIEKNFETGETTATVNVYEKHPYKVKVALPAGAELPEGVTLANLKVTLSQFTSSRMPGGESDEEQSDYTVLTDSEGVAEFSVLDPVSFRGGAMNDSSYNVIIEVPATHALYGHFAYIAQISNGVVVHKTVKKDNRDITADPVALTAVKAYTVSLKVDGNDLEEGTKVTLNYKEYEIGADGTFQVILVPGTKVSIEVDGYDVATPTVTEETNAISATLTEKESNEVTVGQEVNVTGASFTDPVIYTITLSAGDYQVLVDGVAIYLDMGADVWIGNSYYNGGLDLVYCNSNLIFTINDDYGYPEGNYYIEVYSNVTFQIVKVS